MNRNNLPSQWGVTARRSKSGTGPVNGRDGIIVQGKSEIFKSLRTDQIGLSDRFLGPTLSLWIMEFERGDGNSWLSVKKWIQYLNIVHRIPCFLRLNNPSSVFRLPPEFQECRLLPDREKITAKFIIVIPVLSSYAAGGRDLIGMSRSWRNSPFWHRW